MDYRAKDGEMRRVHRETVDVLVRFGRDGRFEPCVVVLKDCRAFRIDEVLMTSGFGSVRHGKRTARFDIRLGGRETQLFLEHQLENSATGVADKYVWWVRAFDGTKRSPAEGCC